MISIVLFGCSVNKPDQGHNIRAAIESMFNEGWNRGEVSVFNETIADSVLFHYAGSPRKVTLKEMSQIVLNWREAFPDLQMDIEELLIQESKAAARLTLSGTHEGPWAGADPTGKQVSMALMMFFRFEDGKVVELWESDDQLGFRNQLGITP
ncbi:hypothetical protein BH23BAC3_BH23BAC3_24060 [soil metagenome]